MMRHACRQRTGAVAMSGPGRAGGIDIGAHGREIGHVARRHPFERRLAAEKRVGPLDPAVGQLGVRIDDLQRLPDPRDVTDAAQGVLRHPGRLALLPFVECALGREAENPAGAIVVHAPALHNAEEALDGPALLVGGHPLDHGGGKGGHLPFLRICSIYGRNCKYAIPGLRSQELAMADKPAPTSGASLVDPGIIRDYHAHIYYDPATTRDRAARLREQVAAAFPEATLGRWHDELVGPHTQ